MELDNIYHGRDGFYTKDRDNRFYGPFPTQEEAVVKRDELEPPTPQHTVGMRLRIVVLALQRGARVTLDGATFAFDDAGQLCQEVRYYQPPSYTECRTELHVCDIPVNGLLTLLAKEPPATFALLAMDNALQRER